MGFEGIVMTVRVRDFLFDGIKTGSAGWMIGLRKDQERKNVLFITDRLPITVFGYDNGFALFNHKNDTMENEWYEVGVPKKERALNNFLAQVETEQRGWDRHTMITKWGQQNEREEETSENNMLSNLYEASKCLLTGYVRADFALYTIYGLLEFIIKKFIVLDPQMWLN